MLHTDKKTPWIFLFPGIFMMLLLVFIPLFFGISYSFSNISQRNAEIKEFRVTHRQPDGTIIIRTEREPATVKFTGLKNYQEILTGTTFWRVLGQTIFWTFTNVFFHFILGLGLALLLNQHLKLKGLWRLILLIPWAVPSYITAFSWRWLFNGDYGLFNHLLSLAGISQISWLSHPQWSMFAVVVTNVWLGVPFMMVTLLGGLQGIPDELYEAARVDGANHWQQFFNVTLPLLKPVAMAAVLLGSVWTFNMFNVIYLVTPDNPHTDILAVFAFKEFFVKGEYGMASAYAVIILLILCIFSLFYLRMGRQEEA